MATFPINSSRPQAIAVSFEDQDLRIELADGRVIHVPLAQFPRLRDATPEQRNRWEFLGKGVGIHWEEIDEDISVSALIGRACE